MDDAILVQQISYGAYNNSYDKCIDEKIKQGKWVHKSTCIYYNLDDNYYYNYPIP